MSTDTKGNLALTIIALTLIFFVLDLVNVLKLGNWWLLVAIAVLCTGIHGVAISVASLAGILLIFEALGKIHLGWLWLPIIILMFILAEIQDNTINDYGNCDWPPQF